MPGQNIIELGFNEAELSAQQKRVVALLTQIYDLTKQLDGVKISPVNITGFTELNKSVKEQAAILEKANKISQDYAKTQLILAKAEEARAKANLANAKTDTETIKQIALEAEYEKKLEAQIKKTTAAKKAQADIPFTSNLNADGSINEPKQGVTSGVVVTDAEKQYAGATNEAVAFGAAQKTVVVENEAVTASLAELTTASDAYVGSINQNIAALIEDEVALVQNKKAQTELLATIVAKTEADAADTAALVALRTEQFQLNESISSTRTTVKNLTKEFLAEEGSIEELRARVNSLTQSYEKLSATEKAAPFGQNIKTQIDKLQPALVTAEAAIGKNQRQVGAYTSSITKAFTGAFSQLRQLAYIIPGLGIAGIFNIAFDAIGGLISELTSSVSSFEKTIQSEKDFADELENTNKLIKEQSDLLKDLTQSDINYYQNQLKFSQASGDNQIEQFAIIKRLNDATKQQADNTVDALQASYSEQAKLKTQLQELQQQQQKAVKGIADADKAIADAQAKTVGLQGAVQGALEKAGKVAGAKEVKENLTASLDALTAKFNAIKSQYEAGQKALTDQSNANAQVEAQSLQQMKFNDDERRKLILAENEIEVGAIEDKNKRILASDKSTLEERIKALQSNNAATNRLAQAQADNIINNNSSSPNDRIIAQEKATATIKQNDAQAQADIFKVREEYRLRDIAADVQINKDRISIQADANKALYDDQTKAFNIRLSAYKNYIDHQNALAKNEFELKLANAGLSPLEISMIEGGNAFQIKSKKITNEELLQLQKDYETQIIGINVTGMRQITADTKAELERQKQTVKDLQQDITDAFEQGLAAVVNDISTKHLNNQTSFIESFLTGGLSKEDLSRQIRDDIIDQQKEIAAATIDSLEKQISAVAPLGEKYSALAKAIAEAKNQLAGLNASAKDNGLSDLADDIQNVGDAVSNLAQAFGTIASISFDQEKQDLQDLSDQQDKNYEQQQKNIQDSTLSDQDKANQLKIIDSEHAARQEAISRKQREIDNEKAQFDKASNIAEIITTTAVAVVKALTVPLIGPALAVTIGALGAAQLAYAASVKVPSYASGLVDAKQEHYGIVGEAGAERLERPGFGTEIVNKATLVKLPVHSNVIPLTRSVNAMANSALGNGLVVMMHNDEKAKDESWDIAKWQVQQMKRMQPKRIRSGGNKYGFADAMYIAKNIKHTA